jgi:hypothetical protein
MGRKKIARYVYLEPEQDQELREVAARTNLPASLLVREGVDRALDARREDGRHTLTKAERLVQQALDGDHTYFTVESMAKCLRTVADQARQLRQERDSARAYSKRLRGLLLEIGEMTRVSTLSGSS